jgi:hypothetical protein
MKLVIFTRYGIIAVNNYRDWEEPTDEIGGGKEGIYPAAFDGLWKRAGDYAKRQGRT